MACCDRTTCARGDPLGLNYRKISGHDPATWEYLAPELEKAGWSVMSSSFKLHREPSTRPVNQELEIRVVDPMSKDLESLYTRDGQIDGGFLLARAGSRRAGGEHLIGYSRGKPASCTGWFVVDRIARFRHVLTAPWARNRGYAGTLIQHVQLHQTVRTQDALVIFVSDDGPVALYEDLGFRTAGVMWDALYLTD